MTLIYRMAHSATEVLSMFRERLGYLLQLVGLVSWLQVGKRLLRVIAAYFAVGLLAGSGWTKLADGDNEVWAWAIFLAPLILFVFARAVSRGWWSDQPDPVNRKPIRRFTKVMVAWLLLPIVATFVGGPLQEYRFKIFVVLPFVLTGIGLAVTLLLMKFRRKGVPAQVSTGAVVQN